MAIGGGLVSVTLTASPDFSEQRLQSVRAYLAETRELFRSRAVKISAQGSYASLIVFFAWKQEDHADTILKLGIHRDVQLVARSMIEGLCQLKWAAIDPETRAERWRLFALVHDWRRIQRDTRAGRQVPPHIQQQVEEGLAKHGHLFERKDAARRKQNGKDPYFLHWSGESAYKICEAVNGQKLYDWAYSDFSDWHHWSPGGVFKAIKTEGRKVSFPQPTARDVLGAHAVAFQCLFETVEQANRHFKLGFDADLERLHQGYLRDMTPPAPTT